MSTGTVRSLIIFMAGVIVLSSCTSPKQILYFQDIPNEKTDLLTKPAEHIIAANDILQITISSFNAEADAPFAKSELKFENTSGYSPGYLVDSAGSIDLPYLGTLHVAGYTAYRLKTVIRNKLSPFLRDPVVNIRITNYKISVLGEVTRPGTYTIPSEVVTLPEALSMAGDLTINAKRDNVMIIRQENGRRVYKRLDLRNSNLFQSPYYYLSSNDIIYVEPAKSKIAQADSRRWQIFTFIVTLVSLGTVIVSRID